MISWKELREAARKYTAQSPLNVVEELDDLRIYEPPIFGLAVADDPLFLQFKDEEVIGPHHMAPLEWLPGARTVISYFLPFSLRVRESNREDDSLPSTEWLYGRIEGEKFNVALREYLVEKLEDSGFEALAPVLDSRFEVVDMRGNWSERHAAFAAGLGTFDLSRSLITEKGCAGRYGSVVTTCELPPQERSYSDVYTYCSECGVCISRCPAGAISAEKGKDHELCSAYIRDEIVERYRPRYGCGKCQTGVPCEDRIPSAAQSQTQ